MHHVSFLQDLSVIMIIAAVVTILAGNDLKTSCGSAWGWHGLVEFSFIIAALGLSLVPPLRFLAVHWQS